MEYENEKVGVSQYFETSGFTNILPHGKKRMSATAAVQNTSKLAFYFCLFFSQIFYPTVISFKPSGSFSAAVHLLCKKASKAVFSIRRSLFSEYMNTAPQLRLFDSSVKPILLYCSELWSLDILVKENANFEDKYFSFPPVKVQIKFIKHLLGVNRGAVNLAVFSELGVIPISIDAIKLSVGFWNHLVNSDDVSLIEQAYKFNFKHKLPYTSKIRLLFKKLGFCHVWENQNTFSKNKLLKAVYNKLSNNFISYWKRELYNDDNKTNKNKLRTYREL